MYYLQSCIYLFQAKTIVLFGLLIFQIQKTTKRQDSTHNKLLEVTIMQSTERQKSAQCSPALDRSDVPCQDVAPIVPGLEGFYFFFILYVQLL